MRHHHCRGQKDSDSERRDSPGPSGYVHVGQCPLRFFTSAFVESVVSREPKLEDLRREFESALKAKDLVGAQKLSEKIRSELVNRIAI